MKCIQPFIFFKARGRPLSILRQLWLILNVQNSYCKFIFDWLRYFKRGSLKIIIWYFCFINTTEVDLYIHWIKLKIGIQLGNLAIITPFKFGYNQSNKKGGICESGIIQQLIWYFIFIIIFGVIFGFLILVYSGVFSKTFY